MQVLALLGLTSDQLLSQSPGSSGPVDLTEPPSRGKYYASDLQSIIDALIDLSPGSRAYRLTRRHQPASKSLIQVREYAHVCSGHYAGPENKSVGGRRLPG
ncbi:hypothetical protein BJX70DRAFT_378482 [Aspergillus crustosus]